MKAHKHFFGLLFILIIGLGCSDAVYAQNLVPNPSFEDTVACPIDPSGHYFLPYYFLALATWTNPCNNTNPDNYNACAPHRGGQNLSVPNNYPWAGWQYAHTGSAYVGIGIFLYDGNVNYREYVQCQLVSSLLNNHKYCIEFYVNSMNYTNLYSNNIGLYLSDTPPVSNGGWDLIGITPTINANTVVEDTVNWIKVSGEYIAHGGEDYVTIGNFYNNIQTDTIRKGNYGPNWNSSYYYIDDVSITDCTNVGVQEDEWQGQSNIYPNPAKDNITIDVFSLRQHTFAYDVHLQEINITNSLGQTVLTMLKPAQIRPGECTINISHLPQGIYFVAIKTEDVLIYKKVVKE